MKQNPFSLYDFMGYLIPGATAIYLFHIVFLIEINKVIDLNLILTSFPNLETEGIIIFTILSYSTGHLISYISSITIEKYSVWKYGYPSKYLLKIESPKYWDSSCKFHSIFWRLILPIILLPTVILDYIAGHFFGFKYFYSSNLDPMLIKIIKNKTNTLLDKINLKNKNDFKDGEGNSSDFHRIILHYTYENSKNHQWKLTNYIALYGFLRTFTLIANIFFWFFIYRNSVHGEFNINSFYISVTISVIAYLFFMSFMKFYRKYTLEGLMILTILDEK